jgi:two-component system sensor histidine kinase KdpD
LANRDAEAESELVATIREEGERLHHLIGNILDMTRIRAGEIRPRLEVVELADIVNAALRRSERVLAKHTVVVELPTDLPMLRIDLFLMEQTLVNLLENAAKYSPSGSRIEVAARLAEDHVVVDVRDYGVGIAPADLRKVFTPLYRAEMRDAAPPGTGLGLSICRAFVEAHGGSIEAFSGGTGTGATFRIALPLSDEANSHLKVADE